MTRPSDALPLRPLAPAAVSAPVALVAYPLGRGALLLAWDAPQPPCLRTVRVRIDGVAVKPPFTHASLARRGGGVRTLLSLRAPMPAAGTGGIEVGTRDGALLARSAADGEAAGEFDAMEITRDLAAGERARLVRFIIEVCGSLFALDREARHGGTVRTLLLEIAGRPLPAAARCRLTARHVLCETLIPTAMAERPTAVLVSATGVHRPALAPLAAGALPDRPGLTRLWLIVEDQATPLACDVIVFADGGLARRRLPRAPLPLPGAHRWLESAGKAYALRRRHLLDALAGLAARDADAAVLLRELQLTTAAHAAAPRDGGFGPTVSPRRIVGAQNGVLVTLGVEDPHALIDGFVVERGGIVRGVALDQALRIRGSTAGDAAALVAFFVADSRGLPACAPAHVSFRMRSGECRAIVEAPVQHAPDLARDTLLSALPVEHAPNDTLLALLAQAAEALTREQLAAAGEAEAIDIGRAPAPVPAASVIMPFDDEPARLRSRLAGLAAGAQGAHVELIHVLDRPEACDDAVRQLTDLWLVTGIPGRLLVTRGRVTPGRRLGLGAEAARGAHLIFLGEEVIPVDGDWAGRMSGFLAGRQRRGLCAGQLLYEDQSLVDAGYAVGTDADGRFDARRRLAGFPRDYAAAAVPERIEAVPAGFLCVARSTFATLGGFAAELLTAEMACVDLCLRAGAAGLEVWRLPEPAAWLLSLRADDAETRNAAVFQRELDRRRVEQRWRALQAATPVPASAPPGVRPASAHASGVRPVPRAAPTPGFDAGCRTGKAA